MTKKILIAGLVSILTIILVAAVIPDKKDKIAPFQKNEPVLFSQIKIKDPFWTPILKTHANMTLNACINQCENETGRIDNFAIAAGIKKGKFKGFVYDDSDVYKMIEGIAYSLVNNPNPVLENKMDSIINLISGAQAKDGYVMTYYLLGDFSKRWTEMDKHEMYCCGHLIEAAVAVYNSTGKKNLLEVACKYADHICRTFGPGKRNWVPGHQEIELALVKLYRTTGQGRYLELAEWLLEQRGHNLADWKEKDYYQDLIPVRELSKISGHAVRAMYMFTGMADVANITHDTGYIGALECLWDDVVLKKMYITGGIGSSGENEGFSTDYDLPNETAYCETCASVGMIFWNQRMNMLKGDSKYVDVIERCLYNGALAGISQSGDRFFYVNPLASNGTHHRKAWYGTACCPSQICRFLPSIGNYIYAKSDDAIWVNLFISNEAKIKNDFFGLNIKMNANYPWEGDIKMQIDSVTGSSFAIKIRIPGWCNKFTYSVNGKKMKSEDSGGYLTLSKKWKNGDIIRLKLDMPVEVIKADQQIKADIGKRAIQKGPLVYCLEETDNPDIANAQIDSTTIFNSSFDKKELGGVVRVTGNKNGNILVFIPYYAWDNRAPGKMKVWVDYNNE
jgi:uncharacterized protein